MVTEERTQELIKELREALIGYDEDKVAELSNKILEEGVDPFRATMEGLADGMIEVGEMYDRKDEFDIYFFFYFPENEIAIAEYTRIPPAGNTGVGRTVATLEGIKTKEEAFEKLKEEVDKL
ncbi:MAG: B12-binding domain-containing protein [Desulfobacteraceae bacterium]|nr:B12-binding domain-containing protein [Desulfobacteraceae bacterium]